MIEPSPVLSIVSISTSTSISSPPDGIPDRTTCTVDESPSDIVTLLLSNDTITPTHVVETFSETQ